MSYIEDVIYEDPEFYTGYYLVELRLELGAKGKWETRDEGIVKIKDMDESHIKNVIKILKRSEFVDEYEPLIRRFEKELIRRKK